jgi:hypothetical protein
MDNCDIKVPREIRCSSKDDNLESFRKKLLKNKFHHQDYEPNLDGVFSGYLFKGILD